MASGPMWLCEDCDYASLEQDCWLCRLPCTAFGYLPTLHSGAVLRSGVQAATYSSEERRSPAAD
jgi:hypothetical protein